MQPLSVLQASPEFIFQTYHFFFTSPTSSHLKLHEYFIFHRVYLEPTVDSTLIDGVFNSSVQSYVLDENLQGGQLLRFSCTLELPGTNLSVTETLNYKIGEQMKLVYVYFSRIINFTLTGNKFSFVSDTISKAILLSRTGSQCYFCNYKY